MTTKTYDVIVVGSGASGGWVAKELTEKGVEVLMLEAGPPRVPTRDFTEHIWPYQLKYRGFGNQKKLLADQPVQRLCYACDDYSHQFFVNDSEHPYTFPADKPFMWIRGRQVGGKTFCWARVSYRYSGRATEKPVLESWPIHQAADWLAITPRPHDRGALGEQIEAVRLLRRQLPDDVPLIETVFTPLAVLGEMVPEPGELRLHLRQQPNAVRGALEAVTTTYVPFVRALLEAGADGIYFATTDWASRDLMTPDDYRAFVLPHTRAVIRALRPSTPVIHFGTGTATLLPLMREAGGDVIGLDWRIDLDRGWAAVGQQWSRRSVRRRRR